MNIEKANPMKRLLILIVVSFLSISVQAQRKNNSSQNITAKEGAKIQAQKKKEREEKAAAEYKQRLDRHTSIQDKQTQKRMKANAKRSKKMDSFYRPPFYKRWFGKK
jgi:hypothetical protein